MGFERYVAERRNSKCMGVMGVFKGISKLNWGWIGFACETGEKLELIIFE